MTERYTGTIKFFNQQKGFGFLIRQGRAPGAGEGDDFVHISAFDRAGIDPVEGMAVSYDLEDNRGRMAAVNLSKVA